MNLTLVRTVMTAGTLGMLHPVLAQTKTPAPPAAASDASTATNAAPRIEFANTTFDFGKLNAGESVRHEFVFTNSGTALLEIKDVRPGCGCTTAGTWDRSVEPGKTGAIPLQFNSTSFGGPVAKSATVICNDPSKSNIVLRITGTVWKPIEVTPAMAMFTAANENQTNQTKVVRIVSNLDEPLTLSDLTCTNQTFKAELKTVRPEKEFELHITAVPPFPSPSTSARVSLKTSSPKMPTINVSAYVTVQQPVVISPNQIMLPPGPLTNATSRAIMIRSNGTNALALSDAKVNVPDAEVHIQETVPGRLFNLSVRFPEGFHIQPDRIVEVTLKSDHPKFQIIRVPVVQTIRSARIAPGESSPVRAAPPKDSTPVTGAK